jgi:general secretion pathway protein K
MTRRAEDGFILIAVLWMLALLAALASAYAVYAVETAPSAKLIEQRLRAEAAIRAGVELCAFRELSWPKAARPDGGAFSTRVGDSVIDVIFRAESARVDLNAAPRDMIAGLFNALGAAKSEADFAADRVVAWRGRLGPSERQAETAIYAKFKMGYGPRGAPFDNALELALLPGVSPELARRAVDYMTIFGVARIDPLIADPLVLAALPGVTPQIVKNLLAARRGPRPDSATLARIAGPVGAFIGADPSDTVRAEIVASLDQRRLRAEVVLKIADSGPAPYEILYWRDDFDGD